MSYIVVKTDNIPLALHSICNTLRLIISVFEPVREWIVGASKGFITIRSVQGLSLEERDEISGLARALYGLLSEFGCQSIEVTSFTGAKALRVIARGTEYSELAIIPEREDNAPKGILIRAVFYVANEKEMGDLYTNIDGVKMAIEPLLDAHGPYFTLPAIYYNGNLFVL